VNPSRVARACALGAVLLVLAGCTVGPPPEEVRAQAQTVFDRMTAALGDVDPEVVRAVEVAPVERVECADDAGTQESLVATGTLAVAADESDARGVVDDVQEVVDGEEFTRIRVPEDVDGQAAWISEAGIVVTLAFRDPVVVVGVFPPCADR
jgi:hypothetical protein